MTQSKNLNDPNQPPSKAGPPVEKKNRPFKSTNYFYEVNDAKGKTIRIRINHVKYELDEFLNEAWDTEDRPKANAAYVNELYSPCPDDYQIRAVKNKRTCRNRCTARDQRGTVGWTPIKKNSKRTRRPLYERS